MIPHLFFQSKKVSEVFFCSLITDKSMKVAHDKENSTGHTPVVFFNTLFVLLCSKNTKVINVDSDDLPQSGCQSSPVFQLLLSEVSVYSL